MFCVGITGNIGSGKSKVCEHFKQLGIDVISADAISRELTAINTKAFNNIVGYFGQQVVDKQGGLNRNILRKLICSNNTMRLWLENLLHPLIRNTIQERLNHSTSAYCIIEIPLLKNKQDYPYLSRILVITANQEYRIQRVMQRDDCDKPAALAIIALQPKDCDVLTLADDVLINDGSTDELGHYVNQLHANYLLLAKAMG